MYYLSFPGLGIEPFHIDRIAFSVFGRGVAWYGILITLGMVLAVLYACRIAEFEKLTSDDIIDLAYCVILVGVLCARLYYVIFTWKNGGYLVTSGSFLHNLGQTAYNIIAIWNGGLAIYGGIIGGLLAAFVFAKKKKVPFLRLFDILVPCVLVGQVIGRWGNFINIEAYGTTTDLPWRMGILYSFTDSGIETGVWDIEKYVHPTFLYESLWNLIALIVVLCIYRKKKENGQIFAGYLMWYGFGRMLIEGLRTDSLMLGNLRVSQGVGACSLIIGIILTVYLVKKVKAREGTAAEEEYKAVYSELAETKTVGEADDGIEKVSAESEKSDDKTEEKKGE